jgi:hypothetical protein
MARRSRLFTPVHRALLLSLLSVCVALGTSAAVAVAEVPSLTGETFNAFSNQRAFPAVSTTASCVLPGSSTFVYRVSGTATGPYPGPFRETGSVTIGPQTPTSGGSFHTSQIQAFSVEFTIDSPAGQVIGTKTLGERPETATGICQEFSADPDLGDGSLYQANVPFARYRAEITTPDGATRYDEGSTALSVFAFDATLHTFFQSFSESFSSEYVPPRSQCLNDVDDDGDGKIDYPADPGCATPDDVSESPDPPPLDLFDCKDGGWQVYTDLGFKTQGDCVSWVVTGGRNEAG